MKRRIRDVCRNRRGEGYIDVAIGVLCLMLVVALAMTLFPVFMKKQQLDSFAERIVRQAEIVGSTDVPGMKRFVKCYFELLTQHRLFSTIKPHALIHGAVVLGLKWRSGKVARYLGFATWILPLHFLRA